MDLLAKPGDKITNHDRPTQFMGIYELREHCGDSWRDTEPNWSRHVVSRLVAVGMIWIPYQPIIKDMTGISKQFFNPQTKLEYGFVRVRKLVIVISDAPQICNFDLDDDGDDDDEDDDDDDDDDGDDDDDDDDDNEEEGEELDVGTICLEKLLRVYAI